MKYILTIDDDEALCKLVKKCIETEQVPVYTFLRGEDALSFFYQNQSDCVLVILDIMLPGMDGYSVLEKVRAVSNVPAYSSCSVAILFRGKSAVLPVRRRCFIFALVCM